MEVWQPELLKYILDKIKPFTIAVLLIRYHVIYKKVSAIRSITGSNPDSLQDWNFLCWQRGYGKTGFCEEAITIT